MREALLCCAQRRKEKDSHRERESESSFQLQLTVLVGSICQRVNLIGLPLFQLKERVKRKSEKAGLWWMAEWRQRAALRLNLVFHLNPDFVAPSNSWKRSIRWLLVGVHGGGGEEETEGQENEKGGKWGKENVARCDKKCEEKTAESRGREERVRRRRGGEENEERRGDKKGKMFGRKRGEDNKRREEEETKTTSTAKDDLCVSPCLLADSSVMVAAA